MHVAEVADHVLRDHEDADGRDLRGDEEGETDRGAELPQVERPALRDQVGPQLVGMAEQRAEEAPRRRRRGCRPP